MNTLETENATFDDGEFSEDSFNQNRISITEEIDRNSCGYIERTLTLHDNYLAKVVKSRYEGISNSFKIMEVIGPEQLGRHQLSNKALARAKYELKRFGGYMIYNLNQEIEDFKRLDISPEIDLDVVSRLKIKISSVWDSYLVADLQTLDTIWCYCHVKSFVTNDRKNSYKSVNDARKKFMFSAWYFEELANTVLKNGDLQEVEDKRGKSGNVL